LKQLADIVDPVVRSRMMSGIRGKNTKPELLIRSALHRLSYRYRLHAKDLPGRPDLVFRSRKAAIFVNGCFWHGHDCHLFRWPGSRPDFWQEKIVGNIIRDRRDRQALFDLGFRVAEVWECQLKGRGRMPPDQVLTSLRQFLETDEKACFIGTDQRVTVSEKATVQD